MVADLSDLRPELTLSLPSRLTAATGIDAFLCRNLLQYMGQLDSLLPSAFDAVAARWLPVAVDDDPTDRPDGRDDDGVIDGECAFKKLLGGAYVIRHSANCIFTMARYIGILLPHILKFNKGYADQAYADLCKAMAVPAGMDLHDWMTEFAAAIDCRQRFQNLVLILALLPGDCEKGGT